MESIHRFSKHPIIVVNFGHEALDRRTGGPRVSSNAVLEGPRRAIAEKVPSIGVSWLQGGQVERNYRRLLYDG